jgi:hypothetical protein
MSLRSCVHRAFGVTSSRTSANDDALGALRPGLTVDDAAATIAVLTDSSFAVLVVEAASEASATRKLSRGSS